MPTMILVAVLATLILDVTAVPLTVRSTSPAFCRDLECPEFNTTGQGEGYEVRQYGVSTWVTTTVLNETYGRAGQTGFMRLFRYISGNNKEGVKVAMTVPVIVRVTSLSDQPTTWVKNFTMSFFVPPEHAANPPTPLETDVQITMLPPQTFFVKSFGGFATEMKWLSNAKALKNSLINAEETYQKGFYYTAGYDSPFRLTNRHNEIWFKKLMP